MNDEDELNHILIATHSFPLTRSDSLYKIPSSHHSVHPLLSLVENEFYAWNSIEMFTSCVHLLAFHFSFFFALCLPFHRRVLSCMAAKMINCRSTEVSDWVREHTQWNLCTERSLTVSLYCCYVYEKLKRIWWWIFITSTQYPSHFFSHNFHALSLEKDWRLKFEQARNFPTSFYSSSCLTCSSFFFYLCSCNDFYDTFFDFFYWMASASESKKLKMNFLFVMLRKKGECFACVLKVEDYTNAACAKASGKRDKMP